MSIDLDKVETGWYDGLSYTGKLPDGWSKVKLFVVKPCNAHKNRPYCIRLGGICYGENDFRLLNKKNMEG